MPREKNRPRRVRRQLRCDAKPARLGAAGGRIKEKLLAAQRAGLAGVLLSARNEKDLHDVPASVTQGLRITWLHGVDNAVAAALAPVVPAREAII